MMNVKVAYFCSFLLIHLALVAGTENEEVKLLIETSTGPIKGQLVKGFTGKDARAFYGIPYAEPPVGKLRFKPPVPVRPWTEVLDATKTPFPCYQQYTKESRRMSEETNSRVRRPWSENCLTLNLWSPAITPEDAPVFIYIHGGGFMTGSGAYPYFELSTYCAETVFITISLNYRLGAFGFLSMGTPEVPGNLGIMDQQLALRWLHENVPHFGGKVDALFFVGIEAGAACIGHHIISPNTKGLFKTGITMSGSAVCSWAWHTKEKAVHLANKLSNNLGCQSENQTFELECLQSVHPEDIVEAFLYISDGENFKPNIDGSFIREDPAEAMKAGRFNNVTVIAVNAERDRSMLFQILNQDILSKPHSGLTEKGFEEAMSRNGHDLTNNEMAAVKEWYLGNDCGFNETLIRDAAIEAYGDELSFCCSNEFLNYATENGVLTYQIVLGIPDVKRPPWIGAHERTVYSLLIAEPLDPSLDFSAEFRQTVMGMLYTGKVYARLKAREFQQVVPLYNFEERPYLYFGKSPEPRKNFRKDECVLWTEIIPAIKKKERSCGKH